MNNGETFARTVLAFTQLLIESKNLSITAKDVDSVVIANKYNLKIITEEKEINEKIIIEKKVTIHDLKNDMQVYCFATKDNVDPNFSTVFDEVVKIVSGDYPFYSDEVDENTL